jgi:hypothetical protein
LGQIYNGQVFKGLLFMVVYSVVLSFCLAFLVTVEESIGELDNPGRSLTIGLILVGGTLAVWTWGMVDAHSAAEEINRKNRRRHGHHY